MKLNVPERLQCNYGWTIWESSQARFATAALYSSFPIGLILDFCALYFPFTSAQKDAIMIYSAFPLSGYRWLCSRSGICQFSKFQQVVGFNRPCLGSRYWNWYRIWVEHFKINGNQSHKIWKSLEVLSQGAVTSIFLLTAFCGKLWISKPMANFLFCLEQRFTAF